MKSFAVVMLGAALALGAGAQGVQQTPVPPRGAIIEYTAPTSGTWGPSATAPPTFAFGRPAQVLEAVPGGYTVRQEVPVEQAIAHAAYVSHQVGHPVAVTIPDPGAGVPRVEYVGNYRGDVGR